MKNQNFGKNFALVATLVAAGATIAVFQGCTDRRAAEDSANYSRTGTESTAPGANNANPGLANQNTANQGTSDRGTTNQGLDNQDTLNTHQGAPSRYGYGVRPSPSPSMHY